MRQRIIITVLLLALSLAAAPVVLGQTTTTTDPDAPEEGYYYTDNDFCESTDTDANGTVEESCWREIWECPEPTVDTSAWTEEDWAAYEDENCVLVETGYFVEYEVCESYTDANGTEVQECWWDEDYCPDPEYRGMDATNWTDADWASYEEQHCYPAYGGMHIGDGLPCDEPAAEFWNWSFIDQRQWFVDNCGTDWCPPPADSDAPADGSGWSRADWFKWVYYACMEAPCGDPPEEYWTWSQTDQDAWMEQNCPHTYGDSPHCDPHDAGYDPAAENWTQDEWMEWYYYDCDGAPCGTLPDNFWDMTPEERRAWHEANCPEDYVPPHQPPACHPPPETGFDNMTDVERRQWVNDHCADQCPPLPDNTSGWTGDDWRRYFESCHQGPACPPPPQFKDWTDAERRQWVVDHCAEAACPDLPADTSGWEEAEWTQFFHTCMGCAALPSNWSTMTEAQRDEWRRTNCAPADHHGEDGTDDTGDDGTDDNAGDGDNTSDENGDDAGNTTDDNDANGNGIDDNLEDQARDAANDAANKTGDGQIVVPGFSPLFALAGLGAVGVLLRRRQ